MSLSRCSIQASCPDAASKRHVQTLYFNLTVLNRDAIPYCHLLLFTGLQLFSLVFFCFFVCLFVCLRGGGGGGLGFFFFLFLFFLVVIFLCNLFFLLIWYVCCVSFIFIYFYYLYLIEFRIS